MRRPLGLLTPMLRAYARSVVCELDVCTVLGRRIHRVTGILQSHDMGHSDESLRKGTNVVGKIERRKGIDSNMFDTVVGMEGAS